MQNKKIQLWALSMAGYNCTIEYIAGTTNTCADLLSRRPDEPGHCQEENLTEELDLDVNDNTFQVDVINSNEFEPKNSQAVMSLLMILWLNQMIACPDLT